MMAIEGVARAVSLDPKHPANNPTKHLLSFTNALSQLLAWQHAQRFLENPLTYAETSKTLLYGYNAPSASGSGGAPAVVRSMDDLQERGQRLSRKLCQRVDWLLGLQRNSNRQFDGEIALKVLVADREWATEADAFLKELEHKVVEMLQANQARFQQFREVSRRAVAWPHSPQLRVEIEAAGFAYRPMMIKRDRSVCDECAVEVNGWKPWHNPLAFHDFDKHKVKPPAQLFQAPTSLAVSQMVTDANRKRGAVVVPPVSVPPPALLHQSADDTGSGIPASASNAAPTGAAMQDAAGNVPAAVSSADAKGATASAAPVSAFVRPPDAKMTE